MALPARDRRRSARLETFGHRAFERGHPWIAVDRIIGLFGADMMKAARRTHNDQIKALIARQQRQCRLSVGTALKRRIAGAAGPADRDDSPAPAERKSVV